MTTPIYDIPTDALTELRAAIHPSPWYWARHTPGDPIGVITTDGTLTPLDSPEPIGVVYVDPEGTGQAVYVAIVGDGPHRDAHAVLISCAPDLLDQVIALRARLDAVYAVRDLLCDHGYGHERDGAAPYLDDHKIPGRVADVIAEARRREEEACDLHAQLDAAGIVGDDVVYHDCGDEEESGGYMAEHVPLSLSQRVAVALRIIEEAREALDGGETDPVGLAEGIALLAGRYIGAVAEIKQLRAQLAARDEVTP